jgi:PAS domain S-box-containing protein
MMPEDTEGLEAGDALLAAIVRFSPDFVALAGSDGRLRFVNPAGRRLIGVCTDEDVAGLDLAALVHASSSEAFGSEALSRGLVTGSWSGDLHLRHLGTGAPIPVALRSLRIEEATPGLTWIAVVGRSVVEGHGGEKALQISEERLRQAVRVAQLGIYDHDQRSDTLYWSAQQRAFFGVPAEEPITLQRFLELVHPEDQGVIAAAVKRAHDPASDGLFDVEYRIRRPDGTIRWMSNRGQTFFEGEGAGRKPVRSVGAVVDVTERRAAEDERANLQAQLAHAQKLETVGRLAGGVAHEFNNMLQVIVASTELLRRCLPAGQGSRLVADIDRAAGRARDVTRQLLAYSRKQLISPALVNLNLLIADTRKGLARLISEDVELRFVPQAALWTVHIDPAQVDQILMNLVINACDAMPGGGILTIETANVRLDAEYCRQHSGAAPGPYVMLAVVDNGTGMDADTRAHIFEPFFTTKKLGRGTGLGLATVYGIVDQNRGFISVESEPGHGAAFRVYLPRALGLDATPTATGEASARSAAGTVLLVEDEELVRRTTAATLEAVGYTVLAASGPGEAIAFCEQRELAIDVLLTDVVMPAMSGKELSERLTALRPDLKVVFTSGYTADVIAHHGVLNTAVAFIAKPYTRDDLARKLQSVLTGSSDP